MEHTAQKAIHALLVDDHALFRESVAGALVLDHGISLKHCGSIREAIQILSQDAFDIVLLDHDLGNERASQFLPAARQAGYDGPVLVVTAWVSDNEARRLLHQGVAGIFLKEFPLAELVKSIRTVASGGTLAPYPQQTASESGDSEPSSAPVFNDRQRRVLQYVLEGLSNKEIAWRLQISESYVKAILQSLFQKTGVRTRGQLVRVAFEQYEGEF